MRLEIKDVRLKNIVSGAETVFFEKGFSKASISDICKTVNCSRTTLYNYFENKENIYLAVVNKSFQVFLDYFIQLKSEEKNGMGKIIGFAKGYIAFSKEYPKNYAMILDFYALIRKTNSNASLADADTQLVECSFFPEAKKNAEIPLGYLVNTIREGQKDSSINKDISAEVLLLNIWAYLIGSSHLYNFRDSNQNIALLNVRMDAVEENVLMFIEKILG